MSSRRDQQSVPRGPSLRSAGRAGRRTRTSRRKPTTRPPTTGSPSGPSRPSASAGPSRSTRSSTGATPPFAKWYVGGRLNAAYNCVDRHVEAGNGDRVALHFVGEPEDDTRDITYSDLKDEVSQAANALIELGVETGDRVAIYMPMIPETIVAMLACARLGAPHTVVFGGFSSDALSTRVADCEAKVIITADGGYRRGAAVRAQARRRRGIGKLKDDDNDIVEHVLVVRRTGEDVEWDDDRDVWWHEIVDEGLHRPHARGLRQRAPALRHVHVRHHRQAQGHPAHHRRLPRPVRLLVLGRVRPEGRRRLLVHRRRRLGHRALLHRLRPARVRGDAGALRGHARHPAQGPLVGDHPGQGRHEVLHRAHRHPHVHEVGRADPGGVRPVVAAHPRLGR